MGPLIKGSPKGLTWFGREYKIPSMAFNPQSAIKLAKEIQFSVPEVSLYDSFGTLFNEYLSGMH